MDKRIEAFISGVHNLVNPEIIPDDASSSSLGWRTIDGNIELVRGRQFVGDEGGPGASEELHTGFKADGTNVIFRKESTKIQYLNGATWEDVITGLTEDRPVQFANYQSLAGTFVYVFSQEGLWKICTANPGQYSDQYLSTKNFKGYGIIDRARTLLWGREEDATGLYGSYIDAQDGVVYTTESSEAVTDVSSGTLSFKAGSDRRTCFGIELTVTTSGQVFTDDFNGNLVGDAGGTGTINYMTGAFTTDDTGAGTVDYQWEDATDKGILDFSKSATRLAGEGFVLRQDLNGDAIQTVIPLEGEYYSIKKTSAYRYIPDIADVNPTNEIYRTDIGVPSRKSAIGTGAGIVFINTANPDKVALTILERNPVGDNIITRDLTTHFDYTEFDYTNCAIETFNRYIILACKKKGDEINNRILIIDVQSNTVDVSDYDAISFTKTGDYLYSGSPSSKSVYNTFFGFDDLDAVINNVWYGKRERIGTEDLKKLKHIQLSGTISREQKVQVYISVDEGEPSLVGTIRGDGGYVDSSGAGTVGSLMVGTEVIGGGEEESIYPYRLRLRVKTSKFRSIQISFIATGFGYASVSQLGYVDVWGYESKMPKKYRQKQYVSLDGTTTDNDNAQF
jgi:hypothetical protein